jgi:hypothetical protein
LSALVAEEAGRELSVAHCLFDFGKKICDVVGGMDFERALWREKEPTNISATASIFKKHGPGRALDQRIDCGGKGSPANHCCSGKASSLTER